MREGLEREVELSQHDLLVSTYFWKIVVLVHKPLMTFYRYREFLLVVRTFDKTISHEFWFGKVLDGQKTIIFNFHLRKREFLHWCLHSKKAAIMEWENVYQIFVSVNQTQANPQVSEACYKHTQGIWYLRSDPKGQSFWFSCLCLFYTTVVPVVCSRV